MSISTPVSFTGISKFSENFQTLLERSFTVASLPVKNLQTEQAIQLAKQQELGNLAADIRSLGSAVSTLGVRLTQGREAQGAELAARIDNVMAFEKWKAGFKPTEVARDVAGALSRMRYGR